VHGAADPLSRTYADGEYPRASPYFVRLYREVASTLEGMVAAEHTAQVDPERAPMRSAMSPCQS